MAEKRVIEIEVKENFKQVEKDLNSLGKALDNASDSINDVNKSFEEVYGDLEPLSTRMGEAEDRLYELANAGKTTTQEYKDLLKTVADYRKVQINTDMVVDAASSTMATKMVNAIGGVASGFSAVQGVMGLVGVESEEVEQAMLRVQSAMALSQGLEGLKSARIAFKQLGVAVKSTSVFTAAYNFVMGISNKETATNVGLTEADTVAKTGLGASTVGLTTATGGATTAMKLFRLALIATGIGAIIVLVGLLIANFDKVTKVVRMLSGYVIKAYDYFDQLGTGIKVLIGIFFPMIGVVYAAIKALEYFDIIDTKNERNMSARHEANMRRVDKSLAKQEKQREARKKAYDEETGNINRQIKLLEAQGKSTEELEKKQLKRSLTNQRELIKEARLNLQILRSTNLGGVNDEMIEETKTAIAEMKQAILDTETDIKIARIESTKVTKDQSQTNKDLAKTLEDLTQKNAQYGLSERELLMLNKLKTDALIQEQYLKSTDKDKEKQRTDALLENETDYGNQLNALRKKEVDNYETLKTTSAKDGISQLVDTRTKELEIEKNIADQKLAIEKEAQEKAKQLQQQRADLILKSAQTFGEAMSSLNGLLNANDEERLKNVKKGSKEEDAIKRKMFERDKKLRIVQTVIDTASNIVTSVRNSGGIPAGIPFGIAAATMGALQIAAISKSSYVSGNNTVPSVDGGGGVIAPNLNVVGDTGINQLATLQQQPVKAYVVSNDVTSAQQFDLKVQQTASL
jgi:hypothetical protein